MKTQNRFELTRRLTPIIVIFGGFLFLVFCRLLYLQVVMGDELTKQSQVNRIQHDVLESRRGTIYDRDGQVLAADEPVFDLVRSGSNENLTREELAQLSRNLGMSVNQLKRELYEGSDRLVLKGMNDRQRIWFAEHSYRFEDLRIKNRPRRVYRHGKIMAHVLGYTGEINPAELNKRRREGLSQGKIVGKAGVEKFYDEHLQGKDGIRWLETTAQGDPIRVLGSPHPIEPKQGDSLSLHLDLDLQRSIYRQFQSETSGAAIVMQIPNGQIRAFYSHPTYDPNQIVSGQSDQIKKLLTRSGDPLLNRGIHSRFPPGSTFKILPFIAALKDSSYSPRSTFRCTGEYKLGDHTFGCWKEEGHGSMNLRQGLINSCNIFFYKLIMNEVDYSSVVRLGRTINYENPTHIDLPGEIEPQLSKPKLKQSKYDRVWTQGDELNAVIGQGYTLVTPIKQAQILSTLITGRIVQPKVADVNRSSNDHRPKVDIDAGLRRKLINTMDDVADRGTGYRAQHDQNYSRIGVDLIGKTGTVQKKQSDDQNDPPETDAWFISAAPADNPRYVVVVFLARSGSGGRAAAPFARKIYKRMIDLGYFRDEVTKSAS